MDHQACIMQQLLRTLQEKRESERKNGKKSQVTYLEQIKYNKRIAEINRLLIEGKSLTLDDKAYLRSYDPTLYFKVVTIEKELADFNAALKNAHNWEEVTKLHESKYEVFSLAMTRIAKSPVPLALKQSTLLFIGLREAAINAALVDFLSVCDFSVLSAEEAEFAEVPYVTDFEPNDNAALAEMLYVTSDGQSSVNELPEKISRHKKVHALRVHRSNKTNIEQHSQKVKVQGDTADSVIPEPEAGFGKLVRVASPYPYNVYAALDFEFERRKGKSFSETV